MSCKPKTVQPIIRPLHPGTRARSSAIAITGHGVWRWLLCRSLLTAADSIRLLSVGFLRQRPLALDTSRSLASRSQASDCPLSSSGVCSLHLECVAPCYSVGGAVRYVSWVKQISGKSSTPTTGKCPSLQPYEDWLSVPH